MEVTARTIHMPLHWTVVHVEEHQVDLMRGCCATLCNLPKVRETLATEGISIPKDTVFVAAEHITTLDELRWLYVPELSDVAQEAFDRIQATLPKVSDEANAERIVNYQVLEWDIRIQRLRRDAFAEDWSEVRPEWGLARNATFIIGDRNLPKSVIWRGELFSTIITGRRIRMVTILANIITGRATVAQWINLQYYASTVAPHYYGSGNKTTQTVTAGIGVMQGNASDLLSGLPWQSVMQSDQEFYHAPLKIVGSDSSTKGICETLLNQDSAFHQKVQNGWIRLASIDREGNWESWS